MASYEILEEYVQSQRPAIDQAEAVTVEIRDTATFERLVVRAVLGPPERPLQGGDRLILKNLAENVSSDAWTIRIVEELDVEAVAITPQSSFRKNASHG
jgi:hypothetical protein